MNKWKYTADAVLDKTHLKYFIRKRINKMYKNLVYRNIVHDGIRKTKSLKSYLYNIFLLFTVMDIYYLEYATVVKKNDAAF